MDSNQVLRDHLSRALDWKDTHVTFEAAVDGVPPEWQGKRPPRMPHSAWQLVEHIRRTQNDILEFCRNPDYQELDWPADYWPENTEPPTTEAWQESIAAIQADRAALKQLSNDPAIDLFAKIPHGTGQTYLREVLLVIDHTAYHVGQLVLLRRILGDWKES